MSPWGWKPQRSEGIWRHGLVALRPLVAAAPWMTVGLLLVLFWFVGGTLTRSKGLLFDLPDAGFEHGVSTDLVALVLPLEHETVVFFDDARFQLGNVSSLHAFEMQLAERLSQVDNKNLLVLADRRISGGDLMKLVSRAKACGVRQVLLAEKERKRTE